MITMNAFYEDVKYAAWNSSQFNVVLNAVTPSDELVEHGFPGFIRYEITTLHGGDRERAIRDCVEVSCDEIDSSLDKMFEICDSVRAVFGGSLKTSSEELSDTEYVIYFNFA